MGEIKLTRIDARLVHGQVAGRWIKFLSINKIVIVNDTVANDPFMVQLFQLACPPNTIIECLTTEKAVEAFNANKFGDGNILLLFKDVETCKAAYDAGITFDSLDMGNVPGAEDRIHCSETVCLSLKEFDTLKELEGKGVNVYFRQVPESSSTPLTAVADKFAKIRKG